MTQTVEALAEHDFIARVAFDDLKADAEYRCTTRIGADESSLRDGPEAYFQTLQGEASADPVRLVVVTGMNYAKFHGDDRIDREQHKL